MLDSRTIQHTISAACLFVVLAMVGTVDRVSAETSSESNGKTEDAVVVQPPPTTNTESSAQVPVQVAEWPFGEAFPEATGLAIQPVYLCLKLGIAVVGGAASGLTWLVTGGQSEAAGTVWKATTSGPWTWHDFIKNEAK